MADALLSPAVGGSMWAASAGTIAFCSRRVRADLNDSKVPLMGVLGAFVFAVQMINFSIPGTGSSGHLGGGMILAVLLGPAAALVTIASVLTVQALFFADGGLLALGCNIFNLGILPCLVAYPLVFRNLAGRSPRPGRLACSSIVSSVVGLQLGALAVVLETHFSGISALPFRSFIMVMQPLHLPIGIVEGAVTAMVVSFVWRAEPETLNNFDACRVSPPVRGWVLAAFLLAALAAGGGLSWFASAQPDGLEWSISRVTGEAELAASGSEVHSALDGLQRRTALLPDYDFRGEGAEDGRGASVVDAGSTVSALAGGTATLAIVICSGWLLRRWRCSGS